MPINYFTLMPYRKIGRAFNFIFGGRGIGKTFNGIYEPIFEYGLKEIYMRRTSKELDTIAANDSNMDMSPFAKINKRSHDPRYMNKTLKPTELHMEKLNKDIYGIYNGFDEPKHVGMALALSTVATIRSFDASDYDCMIYDEFIPEKHVRKIGKDDAEGEAFLNAYETINRDREYDGLPPIQCFLMTNANDIACPLLDILNLTNRIESMRKKKQHFIDLPKMNCTLTLYEDKEFKEAKKKTALYQLTQGTKFYDMAIENDFAYNDFSLISSRKLSEYKPWAILGDICIYRHKSRYEYYVSPHIMECEKYDTTEQDVKRFIQERGRFLYGAYLENQIHFENFKCKKKLLEVIG